MEDEIKSPKEYLISYINDSPGIHRITNNYAEYIRTPIGKIWKKLFGNSPADDEAEQWLNLRKQGLKNLEATEVFVNPWLGNFYKPGEKDENGEYVKNPMILLYEKDPFRSKSGLKKFNDASETHEYSHASLPYFDWHRFGSSAMYNYYAHAGGPENDKEMDYEIYDINHDKDLGERQADKDAVRYLLYKTGIYDSRGTENVTKEQIQQLRKWAKDNNYYIRMLEQSNDDQIVWLLNNIAKAPSKPTNTFYAKNGGKLKYSNQNNLNYLNYIK